jgi:hypothetical protein
VRLHGFAFLVDDPVNVRIRPAFGDYFRARESPRFRNPVVRFIRFNRNRHALTGGMPRRASSSATFPAVLSMNSGCVIMVDPLAEPL